MQMVKRKGSPHYLYSTQHGSCLFNSLSLDAKKVGIKAITSHVVL